jgi:hypothetical protein
MILAVLTGSGSSDAPASLETLAPERWTNAAAAGWGGDAYHHYVCGPRSLTILATLWDTPGDAIEFEIALATHKDLRTFRRFQTVIVLAGDLGSAPEAVAEAAFSALTTGRVPAGNAVR